MGILGIFGGGGTDQITNAVTTVVARTIIGSTGACQQKVIASNDQNFTCIASEATVIALKTSANCQAAIISKLDAASIAVACAVCAFINNSQESAISFNATCDIINTVATNMNNDFKQKIGQTADKNGDFTAAVADVMNNFVGNRNSQQANDITNISNTIDANVISSAIQSAQANNSIKVVSQGGGTVLIGSYQKTTEQVMVKAILQNSATATSVNKVVQDIQQDQSSDFTLLGPDGLYLLALFAIILVLCIVLDSRVQKHKKEAMAKQQGYYPPPYGPSYGAPQNWPTRPMAPIGNTSTYAQQPAPLTLSQSSSYSSTVSSYSGMDQGQYAQFNARQQDPKLPS